ncbi:RNA-guided pseudouridylation complex pseudouridine synthase subunit Cbf5 [Halorientalis salina]|uniref:RNA-guided pseudouridylation complex pseudouridine synthase subunit Cbf5 n=1 Tax=Halorientalis salina TaxID=2932266 RepID=UPI0010AC1C31|nr:RNA-guided pseudouridylation complex pseudouridine synthase subunit Cbf5 [Halorientalis salina]
MLRGPPAERSPAELLEFGVVNLDKPPGPSAHQVAAWVRDMVDADRIAHAGTLDPKVTGCLPLLLDDAARMAQVFDDADKEYVAVLELHGPAPNDLHDVVSTFEGRIYQKPPRKSAVRRQLRVREMYDIDVLEVQDRQALLRVRCESGTYVRKLCHDIGLALGTGAHMGHLRRTATGTFDDTSLETLEDLADGLGWWEDDDDATALREVVQPAERALVGLPSLTIAPSAAREVAEGAPVYAPGVIDANLGDADVDKRPLVACYTPNEAAVCLGRLVGDPDAEQGTVVELARVLV